MLAYVACLAAVLLIASLFRKEGAKANKKNKNKNKDDTGKASAAACGLSLMDYDYETGTRKSPGGDSNAPPLDPAKCKGITVKRKGACYKSDGTKWSATQSCSDAKTWMKLVSWKDPAIQKKSGKNYNIKGFVKYVNARPKNFDPINSQPIYVSTPAECAKLCDKSATPACVGFTFSNKYVTDNKGHVCVPVKSLQYGNQGDGAKIDDGQFIADDEAKKWTTYAIKGYTPLSSGGVGGVAASAASVESVANNQTVKSIDQLDGKAMTKYGLRNKKNTAYPYLAVNNTDCAVQNLYGGKTCDYAGGQWVFLGDNTSGYRVGNMFHLNTCPSKNLSYLQLERGTATLCANSQKLRMGEFDAWLLESVGDGLFKFRVNACEGDQRTWTYLYLNDSGDSGAAWLTNQENASQFEIVKA